MNFITKRELYSARDIKVEAKAQLRGNWKEAVFLALIPTLFTMFFMRDLNETGSLNLMAASLLRVIQVFLVTGVSFTFLDFIRTRKPIEPLRGVTQAFQGKYFLNLLFLKIMKNFYIFLWSLLFIIPGLVKSYSYSQAERIFKDKVEAKEEVPNPSACLKESQALMHGYKIDLFSLGLSFFGWYLLSIASFGIGLIWVTPYAEVSQTIFYQMLLRDQNIDRVNNTTKQIVDEVGEVGRDPDDFRDFEDF